MVQWLGCEVCNAVAPGSNPVLITGQDLFPVVPDSTLPRFVNSLLPVGHQDERLRSLQSLIYFNIHYIVHALTEKKTAVMKCFHQANRTEERTFH